MRAARAVLAAVFLAAGPACADPVIGTWTLSVKQSKSDDVCYVTTLEDLGNGKFREAITRLRPGGETIRQDAIFAFDSLDHPSGPTTSTAFTRIDDRRYVMVLKDHGKTVSNVMRTVTDDDNTMLHAENGTRNGRPYRADFVFERRDSSCETANKE
jgi:hypothetical protein